MDEWEDGWLSCSALWLALDEVLVLSLLDEDEEFTGGEVNEWVWCSKCFVLLEILSFFNKEALSALFSLPALSLLSDDEDLFEEFPIICLTVWEYK